MTHKASGSVGNWVLDDTTRYVYDNYKKIETLDALSSNAVTRKEVWQGERFLSETIGTNTYYTLLDANKNVTEYLDSAGAIQEHTEYSPFGKVTVQNGAMAGQFDYRFSSEYGDDETGLVYYNYRYYSAELGRWTSRDPIEERGTALYFAKYKQYEKLIHAIEIIKAYWKSKANFSLRYGLYDLVIKYNSYYDKILKMQYDLQILPSHYMYIYILNNPINLTDSLGLDEACKNLTIKQTLNMLDKLATGKTKKMIKMMKLLLKLKKGLKKIKDPKKLKKLTDLIKEYQRLIDNFNFENCCLDCKQMLDLVVPDATTRGCLRMSGFCRGMCAEFQSAL